MATFSSVTRQHLLQAIAEHDARGGDEFRAAYGFADAPTRPFTHDGRTYDATSVLGVAHRLATGRLPTPEEVTNGLTQALVVLRKRGFEVAGPAPAPRAERTRAARTPRSPSRTTGRSSAAEVAPAICPTCSMALPATGICDSCA